MNSRKFLFFLLLFPLILLFPMSLQAQFSGEIRIQTGGDTVDGHVAQSSLEEGFNYTVDVRFYLAGLLGESWEYSSNLDLRQSTDVLMERDDSLQLKRFLLQVDRDDSHYRLGNLYLDLGRYFFNQRYLGLDVNQSLGPLQMQGFFGERHPAEEGTRYARYNYGLRLDIPFFTAGRTMLSAITTTTVDDPTSLENIPRDPLTNNVYGIIFQTAFLNIGLQGSAAVSTREEGEQSVTGNSFFLQSDFRWNRILLSTGFEQVSPYFASVGGTAVPDRNTFNLRLRARVSEPLDLDLRYSQYHNNLEGQLERTVTQRAPRLQFSVNPPAHEGIRITAWLTGINKTATDDAVHNDEMTLGLRYLQRIQLITFETGVEQKYFWDYLDPAADERSTSYTTSLRGRYPLEDLILQPGLVLTLRDQERDGQHLLTPLYQLEMGLVRENETAKVSWSQRYRDVDGIREGGRDTLGVSISYDRSEMETIELSYSKSLYYFPDPANDYTDNRVKVTYRYRF